MTKKTRVLWLCKGLGRGGTERLLVSSAALLDHDRFVVDAAYLVPSENAFVRRLEEHGVRVRCLGQAGNADLRWLSRLRKLIHEREYDIVHTHMPLPAAFARLVVSPSGPALMHTEHNLWSRYHWATYWANALTYHRNTKVIAVSKAVADGINPRLMLGGQPDVEVLYHGIDIQEVEDTKSAREAARNKLGYDDDAFVVGNVGNFTPKKDHRTLIEAFAQLIHHVPNARLILIGRGPLEDSLRECVARHGLGRVVTFAGARDDVREILPGLDAFAMSSLYEGLSIALVEALAAAVPVVVTNVGGMPEVVSDGVEGLLVHPREPQAMADSLRRLAADPELRRRLATNGLRRSRAFDMSVAHQRIEQIYDEVCSSR